MFRGPVGAITLLYAAEKSFEGILAIEFEFLNSLAKSVMRLSFYGCTLPGVAVWPADSTNQRIHPQGERNLCYNQ